MNFNFKRDSVRQAIDVRFVLGLLASAVAFLS